MRGRSQGRRRSVDRGTHRPAIELRNQVLWGADAVKLCGRPHRTGRYRRAKFGLHAVEDPEHVWKLLAREPGDPSVIRQWCDGSVGEGHNPQA